MRKLGYFFLSFQTIQGDIFMRSLNKVECESPSHVCISINLTDNKTKQTKKIHFNLSSQMSCVMVFIVTY